MSDSKPSYVYVAVCSEHGYCKIGVSIDPKKRVRNLNHMYDGVKWTLQGSVLCATRAIAFALENRVIFHAEHMFEPSGLVSKEGARSTETFKCEPTRMVDLLIAATQGRAHTPTRRGRLMHALDGHGSDWHELEAEINEEVYAHARETSKRLARRVTNMLRVQGFSMLLDCSIQDVSTEDLELAARMFGIEVP